MNSINIIGLGVLGALVGSFLNVWADRMPAGKSLTQPPSHCPHCSRKLSVWELIPVFSWVILRGRCRTCRASIPLRVPLVELLTALLFALTGWRFGMRPYTFLVLLYLALLIVISIIDFDHQRIPNQIIFPALLIAAVASPVTPNIPFLNLWLGGAIAFSVLFLIAVILPQGMGMGDVKLVAFIGLILGYPRIVPILLLGFILGGFFAGVLLITKVKKRSEAVPFGPFLAVAGTIGLLFGDSILMLWLRSL